MIRFSSTIALQYDSIFSPFKACEFDAAIQWAAESALDGVELIISDYSELSRPTLLSLRQKLDHCGLAVSTIATGGAYFREGLDLTSREDVIRNMAFDRICEHINAAELLGSKVTIGLIRGAGTRENIDQEKRWLAESLVAIDAYALQRGVIVVLEAINRYEVKSLNTLADTVDFITSQQNLKATKVLWDVFHANIEDIGFCQEIDRFIKHIGHVHFADNNRSFPGFGKFDFNEIISCLSRKGFDGFVSLECLNVPSADAVKQGMSRFIQNARGLSIAAGKQ